jgi:hypothetical protein
VDHRVERDGRGGGGTTHGGTPEIVRPLARIGGALLGDGGADDVEGRERHDDVEPPGPPGFPDGHAQTDLERIDIVGRDPDLRHGVALVDQDEALRQRSAERGRQSLLEGPEERLQAEAPEGHVDRGEGPGAGGSRLGGIGSQEKIGQVPGQRRVDRQEGAGLRPLDRQQTDHRGRDDLRSGVAEAGDTARVHHGLDPALDHRPEAVLRVAREGLADEGGVGQRRAGDAALPHLPHEDGPVGPHGKRSLVVQAPAASRSRVAKA